MNIQLKIDLQTIEFKKNKAEIINKNILKVNNRFIYLFIIKRSPNEIMMQVCFNVRIYNLSYSPHSNKMLT